MDLLENKELKQVKALTRIIGIILKAWHQKKIVSVKDLINKLRTDAHFHISPKLEQQILQETNIKFS